MAFVTLIVSISRWWAVLVPENNHPAISYEWLFWFDTPLKADQQQAASVLFLREEIS